MATIDLIVNGTPHAIEADAEDVLLNILRERFNLTGCKIGCGEGECGVCTVLVDDQPVRACITPIGTLAGRHVQTIEGLAQQDRLHPLQQAFLDQDALQCGYCTPGMIMAGVGLLREMPDPSLDQIVASMQGNLCRCGAYPRIIQAIRQAAEELRRSATGAQP